MKWKKKYSYGKFGRIGAGYLIGFKSRNTHLIRSKKGENLSLMVEVEVLTQISSRCTNKPMRR